MAYILGYIAADGCLIKRANRAHSWVLNITSKDKDHLVMLQNAMRSDYSISRKYNGLNNKEYYQLQISNFEICKSLTRLGIVPQKTNTLQPLQVPDRFFSDYTRGYFDADGSVYIYSVNGTPQIKSQICSESKPFLEQLTKDLTKALGIYEKSIYENRPTGKNLIYKSAFYVSDSEKLFNFMYDHSPRLFLKRKYDIFEKWYHIKRRSYNIRAFT